MRKKNFRLLLQGALFLVVCVIFYYNKTSYVPDEMVHNYEYDVSYPISNNVAGYVAKPQSSGFINESGRILENVSSGVSSGSSYSNPGNTGSGGFSNITFNNSYLKQGEEIAYASHQDYSYKVSPNTSMVDGGGAGVGGFSYAMPKEEKEEKKEKTKHNNTKQSGGLGKTTPFQSSINMSSDFIMNGPGTPDTENIPLDGNEIFLIIIGITFGLYTLYKRNKNQAQVA